MDIKKKSENKTEGETRSGFGPNGHRLSAPPAFLEAVFGSMTPRTASEDYLGDLRNDYKGPLHWVIQWARYMSAFIPWRAWRALNIALVIFQASSVAVAYAGAPFSVAQAGGVVVALLFLSLRDAHTYPSETPGETLLDAVMAMTLLVTSQVVMVKFFAAPKLALAATVKGTFFSIMSVALLRLIFRTPDPKTRKDPLEFAVRSFWIACWMNVVWTASWCVLTLLNADPRPSYLDKFFGFAFVAVPAFSYKRRRTSLLRPSKQQIQISLKRRNSAELIRKRSLLWTPEGIGFEALFFGLSAAQFAIKVLTSPIGWVETAANFSLAVMLVIVWTYVRRYNRTAARLVDKEIEIAIAKEPAEAQ